VLKKQSSKKSTCKSCAKLRSNFIHVRRLSSLCECESVAWEHGLALQELCQVT